jgi:hypothetical protein
MSISRATLIDPKVDVFPCACLSLADPCSGPTAVIEHQCGHGVPLCERHDYGTGKAVDLLCPLCR